MKRTKCVNRILAAALSLLLTLGMFTAVPQNAMAATSGKSRLVKKVVVYMWNKDKKKWDKEDKQDHIQRKNLRG